MKQVLERNWKIYTQFYGFNMVFKCFRKFHRVLLDCNEPKLLFKVPTVLWRLVDFLIEQPGAMKTPNLFLLSGTTQFNNSIQNSLDLNEPFNDEISKTP